ncbi:MAG TPA: ABC transporter substrate-binding protein, partial [Acetobacteraceae bacterium]|nr:ABC transporter substrate-binding protein [Acetobacteraceae bacterium]
AGPAIASARGRSGAAKQGRIGPVYHDDQGDEQGDEQGRRPRLTRLPSTITRRAALATAAASATLPLLGRRAQAAGEPVVLGWVGPLSPPGGYAEGILMKDAAEMAVAEINAQGGVLGRPLKVVYADTRGMPAEGRTAAERLVQENKVVAVFGEFHSPVALAGMEVYHKYGVPFMACDVWSDKVTGKGYPEVFRNSTAVSLIDTTIGEWIAAAGFKNVAILTEKDDVGLDTREAVAVVLKKANIAYDPVDADPALTDFTSQMLRFKSHKPPYDLFFSEFAEAGAYNMMRQSHDLGFAPTVQTAEYNSGGAALDPTFWQNVGPAGVWMCSENVGLPKSAWNDKTRAFVKDFEQKYKSEPPGAAMESYDAAWLLADAIKTAGSTDPKAIIHALETTSFVGTRGKYAFATDKEPAWHYHQFMEAPLTIFQYQVLKQSPTDAPILWPRKFADVPYTYKKPTAA